MKVSRAADLAANSNWQNECEFDEWEAGQPLAYTLTSLFRYYVAPFNSSAPYYLGHAMKFWNVIYNWGEAGYAVSKGTINRLLEKFNSQVRIFTSNISVTATGV